MNTCQRCGRPTPYTICEVCEEELTIPSEYDQRLKAGFAMMQADTKPTNYEELWD